MLPAVSCSFFISRSRCGVYVVDYEVSDSFSPSFCVDGKSPLQAEAAVGLNQIFLYLVIFLQFPGKPI